MTNRLDDRRARRQQRRSAVRGGPTRAGSSTSSRWLLPGLLLGAVVVAAVVAIALSGTKAQIGASSSLPPATAPASGAGSGASAAAGQPVITGAQLPDFQNPSGDPAVGLAAPVVTGTDFQGKTVTIKHDGRPKAILFIAHWCPHCQAEVPLIEAWVKAGGLPSGVDLISVPTSIDPTRPNYPPDAWLQREGWTVPVIVDPTNTVAHAYGLTAFPYFVYVGADGKVKGREAGELPIDALQATLRGLTGG